MIERSAERPGGWPAASQSQRADGAHKFAGQHDAVCTHDTGS
jgi:hypothetical protein